MLGSGSHVPPAEGGTRRKYGTMTATSDHHQHRSDRKRVRVEAEPVTPPEGDEPSAGAPPNLVLQRTAESEVGPPPAVRRNECGLPSKIGAIQIAQSLTKVELEGRYGMTLTQAASSLGLGRTLFKKACRNHGINPWPACSSENKSWKPTQASKAERKECAERARAEIEQHEERKENASPPEDETGPPTKTSHAQKLLPQGMVDISGMALDMPVQTEWHRGPPDDMVIPSLGSVPSGYEDMMGPFRHKCELLWNLEGLVRKHGDDEVQDGLEEVVFPQLDDLYNPDIRQLRVSNPEDPPAKQQFELQLHPVMADAPPDTDSGQWTPTAKQPPVVVDVPPATDANQSSSLPAKQQQLPAVADAAPATDANQWTTPAPAKQQQPAAATDKPLGAAKPPPAAAGESYVGRRVSKHFLNHGTFSGEVTSYEAASKLYVVAYDDGDSETVELGGVLPYLLQPPPAVTNALPETNSSQSTPAQQLPQPAEMDAPPVTIAEQKSRPAAPVVDKFGPAGTAGKRIRKPVSAFQAGPASGKLLGHPCVGTKLVLKSANRQSVGLPQDEFSVGAPLQRQDHGQQGHGQQGLGGGPWVVAVKLCCRKTKGCKGGDSRRHSMICQELNPPTSVPGPKEPTAATKKAKAIASEPADGAKRGRGRPAGTTKELSRAREESVVELPEQGLRRRPKGRPPKGKVWIGTRVAGEYAPAEHADTTSNER